MANNFKSIQLEMAVFVKNLCELNGIKYYLMAGTALGAVRHAGFIPWDDDLDIGLMREDYDRFIELITPLLGDRYFLQTLNSDVGYSNIYAKLRANGTFYKEKVCSRNKSHSGVFVDIFPIDFAPNFLCMRWLQKFINLLVKYFLHGSCGVEIYGKKGIKKLFYSTIIVPIGLCLKRSNLIKLHNFSIKLGHASSGTVVILGGSYGYEKESFPVELLGGGEVFKFEEVNFMIPHDWHNYLSNLYGNYMELPPIEQRFARHVELSDNN